MNVTLVNEGEKCRFILEGRLTYETARELRWHVITVMRRFSHFEVDLSGVSEVDLCGIHVLRMLQGLDGEAVTVLPNTPLADEVKELLASGRCADRMNCPWKEAPATVAKAPPRQQVGIFRPAFQSS